MGWLEQVQMKSNDPHIFEVFDQRLEDAVGGILASWFIANPNGPTAFAIGYLERPEGRDLFYRWLHFTGGKAWIIGKFEEDVEMMEGDIGHVVFNALIRFHNFCCAYGDVEKPVLSTLPNFVATNGNSSIAFALQEYVSFSAQGENWTQEFYLNEKYGAEFFTRAGACIRAGLDAARLDPAADQTKVDFYFEMYEGRAGFDDPLPVDLLPVAASVSAARDWWSFATSREIVSAGLFQFAQMWVGAISQVSEEFRQELRDSGRYTSFERVVKFFDNFQMPLWPDGLDHRAVRKSLGIP